MRTLFWGDTDLSGLKSSRAGRRRTCAISPGGLPSPVVVQDDGSINLMTHSFQSEEALPVALRSSAVTWGDRNSLMGAHRPLSINVFLILSHFEKATAFASVSW